MANPRRLLVMARQRTRKGQFLYFFILMLILLVIALMFFYWAAGGHYRQSAKLSAKTKSSIFNRTAGEVATVVVNVAANPGAGGVQQVLPPDNPFVQLGPPGTTGPAGPDTTGGGPVVGTDTGGNNNPGGIVDPNNPGGIVDPNNPGEIGRAHV